MNSLLPVMGRTVRFFERNIWRILTGIFFYALITSALTRNVQIQLFQQNANDGHIMNGMLIRSDKGYDYYDFSPMNYDLGTSDLQENTSYDPNANFVLTSVADNQLSLSDGMASASGAAVNVAGPDALLVRSNGSASIFSPQEGKHFPLLQNTDIRAITTGANNSIMYTTLQGGTLELSYLMQCKEPLRISISTNQSDSASTLRSDGLPVQNTLLVSPSENHVLILDHEFDGHIWIVNLTSGSIERLSVPEFGGEQIHFSPIFTDAKTIVFSVWEKGRGATYAYHIMTGNYDMLSPSFSDEIRISLKGELIFVQSVSAQAGNIPFGSVSLTQQNAFVSRQSVEEIFGDDVSWKPLFTDPLADTLRFTPHSKELLRDIQDSQKRSQMTKIWSDIYDPFVRKENELKIFTLTTDRTMQIGSLLYFTDASHPIFTWDDDITPLLQALQIPANIIQTYVDQKAKKTANGESYALTDLY